LPPPRFAHGAGPRRLQGSRAAAGRLRQQMRSNLDVECGSIKQALRDEPGPQARSTGLGPRALRAHCGPQAGPAQPSRHDSCCTEVVSLNPQVVPRRSAASISLLTLIGTLAARASPPSNSKQWQDARGAAHPDPERAMRHGGPGAAGDVSRRRPGGPGLCGRAWRKPKLTLYLVSYVLTKLGSKRQLELFIPDLRRAGCSTPELQSHERRIWSSPPARANGEKGATSMTAAEPRPRADTEARMQVRG